MNSRYFKIYTRITGNPNLAFNGGDYTHWVSVKTTDTGRIVAGYYNNSSDFDFCRGCGMFRTECDCESLRLSQSIVENAELIEEVDHIMSCWLLPVREEVYVKNS